MEFNTPTDVIPAIPQTPSLDNLAQKRKVYSDHFGTNSNCNRSFKDKIALVEALGYLTFEMRNRKKIKESSLEVLEKIMGRSIDTCGKAPGEDSFLTGLSILVDDFIWSTTDVERPADCANAQEVVKKIVSLINNWMPF